MHQLSKNTFAYCFGRFKNLLAFLQNLFESIASRDFSNVIFKVFVDVSCRPGNSRRKFAPVMVFIAPWSVTKLCIKTQTGAASCRIRSELTLDLKSLLQGLISYCPRALKTYVHLIHLAPEHVCKAKHLLKAHRIHLQHVPGPHTFKGSSD